MPLRILAAFSMTLGLLAATIGAAGPTSAAPATWVMPDVNKMVLQKAVKEVQEVTGSAELKFLYIDKRNGQEVHNKSNWVVCYSTPVPGKAISQKKKRVVFYVKRFNQRSCWS